MPFTKLTNVPVKESMTGNEKIIINDDGVTRQTNIPNYVKTIGGVAPDQNGNVEIELGESWPADLPKPSVGGYGYTEQGEQTTITWDGDTEGRVNFEAGGGTAYLVSDTFATIDELDGSTITFGGTTLEITRDDIMPIVDNIVYAIGEGVISAKAGTYDGFVVPTDGVYFAKAEGHPIVTSLTYGTSDTIHKINEKYLPEGGFGWTEQGEQTVITWDGDTEGRESVGDVDMMYKVSNKIITPSDVIGGEYGFSNGFTAHITDGKIFDLASLGIENAFGILYEEGSEFAYILCVQNDTVFGDTPISAGVYFLYADDYVSSLTYGTPETVHKIDEKYLPSGGVMVVTMTVDENNHVESPYTPEEVIAAMQTMPVYCIIDSTTSPFKIGGMFMMKFGGSGISPILRINFGGEDTTALSVDSNGWVFSV